MDPLSAPDDVCFGFRSEARYLFWTDRIYEPGCGKKDKSDHHFLKKKTSFTRRTPPMYQSPWQPPMWWGCCKAATYLANTSKLPLMRTSCVWSSSSLHRLPGCVSERLLEGALVCGARWKPVPAEGPGGPAAAAYHGAAQRCRGGARGPRP